MHRFRNIQVCVVVVAATCAWSACTDQCPAGTIRDGVSCKGMLTGSVAAGSGGQSDQDTDSNIGSTHNANKTMPNDPHVDAGVGPKGGGGGGNSNTDASVGQPMSGTSGSAGGSGSAADSGTGNACTSMSTAVAETCDNLDNDCDGKIDEEVERSCGSSMVGMCRLGKQTCTFGAWGACEGSVEPAMEVCDAAEQDENCDGAANEGCACTPGAMKACGKTGGICMMGQQTCLPSGTWGTDCVGEVQPMPEVCDGRQDEDCDGLPDNGDTDCECVDGMSTKCVAGKGICADGMKTCANGKWGACQGPAPKKEVCDGKGVDEDCDGTADNGCACTNGMSRDCPSGKDTGECSVGTQTCSDGQWSACTGSVGPGIESCDGKDSNCNGVSDDAEPNLCSGGKPCLQNGSKWGCAKCTPATVMQDCAGASSCKTASCTAAGQCKLDDAPELTLCPGTRTHEAYCMSGSCAAPTDASGDTTMPGGSALYPGGKLYSSGGKFELEYQSDGNVTLWAATRKDGGDFVWCMFDVTKPTNGGALVMQPDGNLVLWANNMALWQSNTGAQPNSRLSVTVTDAGRVFLKDRNGSSVREIVGDYKGNVQAN